MEISWTDRVRNKGVLQRGKEERNIVHTIKEYYREAKRRRISYIQ
jgi:hypothetical protein